MDTHVWISVLSVIYSWVFCTVLCAPASPSSPPASEASEAAHVRTKRCSCASFLDKECVYFCHLDIIWVNTPERVVSYGLGNAPRARRALPDSMATGPRCACLRQDDDLCRKFCNPQNRADRYDTPAETKILSPEGRAACSEARCKHKLAADGSNIKRMRSSSGKRASPAALRVALKARLLLDRWRGRQRRRARAWGGESTAS